MNEFAGTVPFLRITLEFDMKTMHFYIAQTGLFKDNLFSHLGCHDKQFGTHEKLVLGCMVSQVSSQTNYVSVEVYTRGL